MLKMLILFDGDGMLGSFHDFTNLLMECLFIICWNISAIIRATLSGGAGSFDLQRITQFIDFMI